MLIRDKPQSEFLSVADVATKLGCRGRRPIYKAIDAGRLHAVRLGPHGWWRIPRASWDAFVKGDKR